MHNAPPATRASRALTLNTKAAPYNVPDVDVILLLATLMASKRRPPELPEIVAGVELIQGLQGTCPGRQAARRLLASPGTA